MVGDVNIFLNDPDDRHCGEIEIMIAGAASPRSVIRAAPQFVCDVGRARVRALARQSRARGAAASGGKLSCR